jgi:putative transposase
VTRGYRLPTSSIVAEDGPEFAGRALDLWAHDRGVAIDFIRPGKLRDECLNENWFQGLTEPREAVEA